MKKTLIIASFFTMATLPIFTSGNTHASCAPTFYVGTETLYGCSGVKNPEITGFTLDVDSNKITLNNYNGGGIYYLCHASCPIVKDMEIELIGENTIISTLSTSFPQENGLPSIIDAGFINIVPTFTGTGSLNINASVPFTFETGEAGNFAVKIISEDFAGGQSQTVSGTGTTEPASTVNTSSNGNTEPVNGNSNNSNQSFFETTAGIITLIAVPSILLLIIIVLVVALMKKKTVVNSIVNTPPTQGGLGPNQQM